MDLELVKILSSRQPESYKETKPYVAEIVNNNKEYIKAALSAIRTILRNDQHKVFAKLNALRFARDCFQTGNPLFVKGAEQYLTESLRKIALDSIDQSKVTQYADKKYTQKEDIAKFKSYLVSIFTLDLECIKNWAIWKEIVQPKAPNPFAQLKLELEDHEVIFPLANEYFKEGSQDIFVRNYSKYPQKQQQQNTQAVPSQTTQKRPEPPKQLSTLVPANASYKQKVYHVLDKLENLAQAKPSSSDNPKYHQFAKEFETALDDYVDREQNFEEEFVNQVYELFEELTKAMGSRITLKSVLEPSNAPSQVTEIKPIQYQKVIPEEVYQEPPKVLPMPQHIPSKIPEPLGIQAQPIVYPPQPVQQFQSVRSVQYPPSIQQIPRSVVIQPMVPTIIELPKPNTPSQINVAPMTPAIPPPLPPQPSEVKKHPIPVLSIPQQPSQVYQLPTIQQAPVQQTSHISSQPKFQKPRSPEPQIQVLPPSHSLNYSQEEGQLLVYSKVSDLPAHTKSEFIPKPKNVAVQPSQVSPISQLGSTSQLVPHSHTSEQHVNHTPAGSSSKGVMIGGSFSNNTNNFTPQLPPSTSSYVKQQKKEVIQGPVERFNQPPLQQQFNNPTRVTFGQVTQQQQMQTAKFLPIESSKLPSKPDSAKISNLQKKINELCEQRERMVKEEEELRRKLRGNKLQNIQGELMIEKRELQGITEEIASLKQQLQHTQTIFISSQTSRERTPREKIPQAQQIPQPPLPRIYGNPSDTDTTNAYFQKLSEANLLLLKRCILRDSQVFYKGGLELQLGRVELLSKNNDQYLQIKILFVLKGSGTNIGVKYVNVQDLDLWTKPVMTSTNQGIFSQDLVATEISNKPSSQLVRGTVEYSRGADTFFLPIRFISFLKVGTVAPDHFSKAFRIGDSKTIRSKILKLNTHLISRPDDFKQYLDCYLSTTKTGSILVNCAYLYEPKQLLLLVSIELLSNQRAVFKALQLDDSSLYSKQLVNDFVFLFSA